ncbi:MAG: protein-glutamate O-methyltransferase CheR [Ignavibacteria bacterium]|jgi:chemotaxis protein methyltransferase CheR|nr:protein-glutamate O-methyltransferase CheR [Ignavibacteria bacterium]
MKKDLSIPTKVVSPAWIEITDKEFSALSSLVYNKIGIKLTEQKKTLLMGRLQKLLREYKFATFQEYYEYIINEKSGSALSELANYISTNHTFFYREHDHFEFFYQKALPEIERKLKSTNTKDIRIWSAGCSSGEEPYTLIMLMLEYFGNNYYNYQAGILATDISEKALKYANDGIYPEDRVRPLPDKLKKKYFTKAENGNWKIVDKVKKEVTFRKFNLISERYPFKKHFDIIFCRNVMIYFDDITREKLVGNFYNFTVPSGYLFIGHSETLNRTKTNYKFIMPALYQKQV